MQNTVISFHEEVHEGFFFLFWRWRHNIHAKMKNNELSNNNMGHEQGARKTIPENCALSNNNFDIKTVNCSSQVGGSQSRAKRRVNIGLKCIRWQEIQL